MHDGRSGGPHPEGSPKTGLFAAEHHDALRTAFDERNVGDYAYRTPFPQATAQKLLERAEAFVNEAEAHLRREP